MCWGKGKKREFVCSSSGLDKCELRCFWSKTSIWVQQSLASAATKTGQNHPNWQWTCWEQQSQWPVVPRLHSFIHFSLAQQITCARLWVNEAAWFLFSCSAVSQRMNHRNLSWRRRKFWTDSQPHLGVILALVGESWVWAKAGFKS